MKKYSLKTSLDYEKLPYSAYSPTPPRFITCFSDLFFDIPAFLPTNSNYLTSMYYGTFMYGKYDLFRNWKSIYHWSFPFPPIGLRRNPNPPLDFKLGYYTCWPIFLHPSPSPSPSCSRSRCCCCCSACPAPTTCCCCPLPSPSTALELLELVFVLSSILHCFLAAATTINSQCCWTPSAFSGLINWRRAFLWDDG